MKRLLSLLLPIAGLASAQGYRPVEHTARAPFLETSSPAEFAQQADLGIEIARDRDAAWSLAEHRRLDRALAALKPQRRGLVDAYVVVAGLDSDPVFGREAREAARVLARRYDAAGRTILLAGSDGGAASAQPMGSPQSLAIALARVAEVMDTSEDVLVLYTTSHGAPFGLYYNDGDQGYGAISPTRLWTMLSQLGIRNRLILLSACYAGIFVPLLQSDTTAIVTAASATRTSFGCQADSDWTFFGDALINHALRKPQSLAAAAAEASRLIGDWEKQGKLTPSEPQTSIGAGARAWLTALDARSPQDTTLPVGRPATTILAEIKQH